MNSIKRRTIRPVGRASEGQARHRREVRASPGRNSFEQQTRLTTGESLAVAGSLLEALSECLETQSAELPAH